LTVSCRPEPGGRHAVRVQVTWRTLAALVALVTFVLASYLVALFIAVQSSRYDVLRATWETYRRDFVTADGRVRDPPPFGWGQTTSEAQAYTMLRATWIGDRETFDRTKILAGLKKACEKRPISIATIETVTDRIEKRIQEMGETEIESRVIGEELMKELHQLDQVAYVRFASVYREFKDIDQFMDELRSLAQQRRER